ncbi:Zn(II)2Cys6 transcription factor [Aspergillus fischeri NRRL 181]|uniref:C6 zinc finger domain protein n=1 Tax=Neosartorya fischeri (strain ATCC 1020 / DSM 3700 / CBS 544.65 / FGSC A1164 / JCM 1740 / NRRL 181 / WB 181) TaxID=331117 RepID=A1D5T8_NEOFI|nr:C6 zinc finger domain protein [Aspergillus fischeri NRRL 181]EAW21082.1 C6 zinc finger domain protein [Aspergillus fischeri NRRL 181]KAG2019273.1 hypothetical protein GB937_005187 [Aspergillus fischeri]
MSSSRPSKRQRICRACDQCRRRKSKCDGAQPVCEICRSAGRTCTYEAGGGRRGLPSGYVRSLETALGLIFINIPNSEGILRGLLAECGAAKARNRAVAAWRNSQVNRGISQMLVPGWKETSMEDSVEDEAEWEELENRDVIPTIESSEPFISTEEIPPQVQPIISVEPKEVLDLPIPDNTSDLLELYFTHTHCWFPILERRDVLRAMHTYPHRSTPRDETCHLMLWAVIAYSSVTDPDHNHGRPNSMQILHSIQRRILSQSDKLELGHIQALLILVLLHLQVGDIKLAWVLVGQVTRLVTMLPPLSKSRFLHTVHACILLDSIASALLNRSPCLSLEEQLVYGPVQEDDVEEWDHWTARNGFTSKGPLRALSTFNAVRQLMQLLTRVLYCPVDLAQLHALLLEIQEQQAILLAQYSDPSSDSATPPLLTLHLAAGFVILALVRHCGSPSADMIDLTIKTSQRMFNLFDRYVKLTGHQKSPLLRCFFLQCRRCLESYLSAADGTEIDVLKSRLSTYSQEFQMGGNFSHKNCSAVIQTAGEWRSPLMTDFRAGQSFQNGILNPLQSHYATPVSAAPTASPALPGEADSFDALFEEMANLIPSTRYKSCHLLLFFVLIPRRLEPEFAHNLGFCAGDLDTDFLIQLQQPP